MKLENETPHAARLFSGPVAETELGCALLVKATYDVREGRLEPATEAPWPIHLEPLSTPYGTFPGEVASRKPRTDVIVLGSAKPPNGKPVRSMTVSLQVGTFRHALVVFGDRRWERGIFGFRASEPVPFHEMPIVWARAYGGTVASPVGGLPCGDNPEGKGFVLEEEDAEGVALPNVEDPSSPVRSPRDAPSPVGWAPYPMIGGVRARGMRRDDGTLREPEELEPFYMNWSHPDLMIDAPSPGTPIEVTGLTREGPLVLSVPAPPFRATLAVGDERRPLTPRLDTLIVETEERRLVARWRAATKFEMRPREARVVRLERA